MMLRRPSVGTWMMPLPAKIQAADEAAPTTPRRSAERLGDFVGWSDNHVHNLHFRISLETT